MVRGPSLVESCHAKWLHCMAAQWLTTSGTDWQNVAPPGTQRRSCAPAVEGSQQQIQYYYYRTKSTLQTNKEHTAETNSAVRKKTIQTTEQLCKVLQLFHTNLQRPTRRVIDHYGVDFSRPHDIAQPTASKHWSRKHVWTLLGAQDKAPDKSSCNYYHYYYY